MQISRDVRQRITEAVDFFKSPLGAFVIAVVGIVLAIYATWFNDKRTEVSVAVQLASDVVNVGGTVPELELVFRGIRLDPSKTPLKVVLIRVWNSGETTIRHADYDPNAPVGFRLVEGEILSLSLERASNDYLTRTARTSVQSDGTVSISPLILEPKDYIILKGILLQPKIGPVSVQPFGKVAGAAGVTERLTSRHPAGYIDGFPTPNEDRWRRIGVALLLASLFGYLIVVLVLDWRKKLRSRHLRPPAQDTESSKGSGSDGSSGA